MLGQTHETQGARVNNDAEDGAVLKDVEIADKQSGDPMDGDNDGADNDRLATDMTGATSNDATSLDQGHWSSRWSFILAAIGSAIGLGNFWRFPFLAYRWGGGAFFIPYLLALVVVGIPLLQLEFALGQVFRRAATQAFGKLNHRFAGVGLAGALIAFGIVGYYCAILGWGNVMFVKSWYKDMPWSIRGVTGPDVITIPANQFQNELLHLSGNPAVTEVMASMVFAGAFFQWACVYLILYKGQDFISKAVWVTVLLPVFTLLILLIVGATLPGATDGIKAYIGEWDMSLLSEGQMWVDAFTQIFFSLSLATGVMSAYASMNPRHQNVVQDAVIVAVCNSFFSFLSGFAVFSIIGYLSHESGVSIEELQASGVLGGPNLAFIAYPSGLSMVSGYGANILTIIFFLTFYMLGIDSAFSLVESVVHNFRETPLFARYSRDQLVAVVCIAGACTTFLYTADIGLYLLDVADRFVSTFGLTIVGFLECIAAGWAYNMRGSMDKVGVVPVLVFDVGMWVGFALFTMLSLGLPYKDGLSQSTTLGTAFGVGLAFMVVSTAVALPMAAAQAGGMRDGAYYLFLHGPDSLRRRLNRTICAGAGVNNWRLNWVWVVLIKYVMSPIMFFLIAINVEQLSADDGYGGYEAGYQAFGTILVLLVFFMCLGGFVRPQWFRDPHAPAKELLDGDEEDGEDATTAAGTSNKV